MPVSDIPNLVQHYRFSDESSAYYDSGNEEFLDLSDYAAFGHNVEKVNGTPAFSNVGPNNRRGLDLKNTNHWQFPHQAPWSGSGMFIARLNFVTPATTSFYPMVFDRVASISSNARLQFQHFSSTFRMLLDGGSSQLVQTDLAIVPSNGDIVILFWERDQEDRKSRYTKDGSTIVESAAYNPAREDGLFIGLNGQPNTRLGNVSGTIGDTTDVSATQGWCTILEFAAWNHNILSDNPSEVAAVFSEKDAFYR